MTTTPNLGLYKPTIGETGWGTLVDGNFDTLDEESERRRDQALNVKEFGALGTIDDPQDDTAAIQDAIDAASIAGTGYGRTVFVPRGVYKITSSLSVPSYVRLTGQGNASQFRHCAGADPLMTFALGAVSVEIDHLTFTGPNGGVGASGGTGTGVGISIPCDSGHISTRTRIHDNRFLGITDATHWCIETSWAQETYIYNNVIASCDGGAIHLGDTSNGSSVRENLLSNGANGAIGGLWIQAEGVLIEGNVIEGWRGDYGIRVGDGNAIAHGTVIIRNWLEDDDGRDVWIDKAPTTTLIGNNHEDGTDCTAAVYADSARNLYIAGMIGVNKGIFLISGAGAAEWTQATIIGSEITEVDTSGLVNIADFVLCMGNRHDAIGSWDSGLELRVGGMFFGEAFDTSLYRSAANVLALGSDDAFKTGSAAHGSLPAASGYAAGAQFYCTSDKKPVWSDGAAHWVDAAGANHT